MIFKKLSAWITDTDGEALPEYQTSVIEDNIIECWIPSTEGTNFQICWKAEKKVRPGLDLWLRLWLDGIEHTGSFSTAKDIAKGVVGTISHQCCGDSLVRLYYFGKRKLTDDEAIAPISRKGQKDLNTIRIELAWGHSGPPKPLSQDDKPETRPIHEKMAKKGHSGSAELGKLIKQPGRKAVSYPFKLAPNPGLVTFLFRYASQDWLQAREIIPSSQQGGSSSSPEPQSSKKRTRSATPDAIDLDDLETDDDEIIIVKHMVPVPTTSNKRPRRVKDEEDI